MALFQKQRPDLGSRINYSTFGMNKTLLIVGLGNPGEEYAGNRHNVGFMCLDEFARKNDFQPWKQGAGQRHPLTGHTFRQQVELP